jgi:Domain of unknown function (DUF4347)
MKPFSCRLCVGALAVGSSLLRANFGPSWLQSGKKMTNRRGISGTSKSKPQRTSNPRLALEPRIVFDGAGGASAADVYSVDIAEHYQQLSLFVPPAVREAVVVVKQNAETGKTDRNADSAKDAKAVASAEGSASTESNDADTPQALGTVTSLSTEIIFIDSSVQDVRAFLKGKSGEVIVLDANRDGVEQIAQALAGRQDVTAIHILSHGDVGQLRLGNATLTHASMVAEHTDELATIKAALSGDADILIYGCNFGQGELGALATEALATLTGADVASSTDVTGHRDLGGNWVLERTTGAIEASIALDERGQADYRATLAPLVIVANTAPVVVPSGGPTIVGTVATYSNVGTVSGVPVMLRATVTAVAAGDSNDTIVFTRNGTQPRIELTGNTGGATLSVRWEILDQATGLVATPADFSIAVNGYTKRKQWSDVCYPI